ncbi:peptidase C65 Otubain-domain-containing protein [Gilbertella persicaria]|uniref:peptidase C65 Otubain-domain-containing protein n=1 Tax=Gilbertella persicaria TaxID=101096 RepID=UPI00222041F5|nr:peptidase C65 Otubain-domain-containing protein [Gilbertella persicaria]KAI8065361.1 peptidase C65 Otubain-domain-containing protein [Gilbertella persicaria]
MSNNAQEPLLTDEQILEFEQQIKDQEAQKIPLVCQEEPVSNLLEEFKDNEPFLRKINNLGHQHDKIRRCRGDGNCFFRAFAFAWFESALKQDKATYEANLNKLKHSENLLETSGFQKLAFEDFYDVAVQQFKGLNPNDPDMLLVNFQSDEISNAIVMHFRFIASAYLRLHSAEYEPFLIDEMISIDEFCSMHVEAFGRESDHLQIIALSKALDVPIQVVYLDGGVDDQAAIHEFWPSEQDEKEKSKKAIKLIYRPGHYDILYNKE